MIEETPDSPSRTERRGLALAALIMSLVALLCAFIVGWRLFSIAVAGAALIVALFVILSIRRKGRSRSMATGAIVCAVLAGIAAGYFLSQLAEENAPPVPAELHDSASAPPGEETLERLRMNMDSTQGGGE